MNTYLYAILFSLALSGCSNELLYQMGQSHKKNECIRNATSASDHKECMEQTQKPFEEYEKEREVIIKK